MGIGKRIKEARLLKKLTQEELALKLGITKSAVANYENETSHPKETVLYKLFSILSVDANYLFQDVSGMKPCGITLSTNEQQLLDNYRKLDAYHQESIFMLAEREAAYLLKSKEKAYAGASVNEDNMASIYSLHNKKVIQLYPYLHNIASAGTGSYSNDIPTESIEAEYVMGADFIIGVNGDSMEPLYHNGDLLYIQKTDHLDIGEIGIFIKDESMYIKKLGNDRLISINPEFPDIYTEEGNIMTVGRVLRKVETDID